MRLGRQLLHVSAASPLASSFPRSKRMRLHRCDDCWWHNGECSNGCGLVSGPLSPRLGHGRPLAANSRTDRSRLRPTRSSSLSIPVRSFLLPSASVTRVVCHKPTFLADHATIGAMDCGDLSSFSAMWLRMPTQLRRSTRACCRLRAARDTAQPGRCAQTLMGKPTTSRD